MFSLLYKVISLGGDRSDAARCHQGGEKKEGNIELNSGTPLLRPEMIREKYRSWMGGSSYTFSTFIKKVLNKIFPRKPGFKRGEIFN